MSNTVVAVSPSAPVADSVSTVSPPAKVTINKVLENMLGEIDFLRVNGPSEIQGLVFSVRAQLQQCFSTVEKKK